VSVVGVGVDAIEIDRIETALVRTPSLLQRMYTEQERQTCSSAGGGLRYAGLAARFAAKEAVAKALGTGVRGFGLRDIEIARVEHGRPEVRLHGGAARRAAELGVRAVHVSLSTSRDLAVASAVLESSSGGNLP
jgi:holo-[acyl-carrier protein] synthase